MLLSVSFNWRLDTVNTHWLPDENGSEMPEGLTAMLFDDLSTFSKVKAKLDDNLFEYEASQDSEAHTIKHELGHDSREGGVTRPWMVEGRTMQDAYKDVGGRAKQEARAELLSSAKQEARAELLSRAKQEA